MKRQDWIVKDHGIRPKGDVDKCFYCGARLGEQHRRSCVIRHKTTIMDVSLRIIVDVPEQWDAGKIEDYHLGDGVLAAVLTNLLNQYGNFGEVLGVRYVGEATRTDEERYGACMVQDLPS